MAVATSTVLIGAAIGAGIGAIMGTKTGGDAIWKGALAGGVAGAVTGGVGSWAGGAAAAGGLGWSPMAAGALAGATGGLTGGVLNTALNGGTGSDYLRSGLTGAALGGAVGGAAGYLSGGAEAAANPEMVSGTPYTSDASGVTTPLPDAGVASSLGGADVAGTAAIDPTLATTATQTPMYGADISYSGPHVPSVGGGAQDTFGLANMYESGAGLSAAAPVASAAPTTTPAAFSGETSFGFDDYPSQAMVDSGTANAMGTSDLASSPTFQAKSLGADVGLDTFDYGKNASDSGWKWGSTGQGKGMNDLFKMMGYSTLAKGGMNTLGALATAGETSQNRQQLMDLYNTQMNQYNQQANAANTMQNRLEETYTNPDDYLNSPEAQAARSLAMQKLLAQNAMAGRRSAGLAMQNQLMMNQLGNLQNYRTGIRQGIQYPNYAPANAALQGAQMYSPTADIMGGLSSAVTPMSLYSLFA